MNPSTDIVEILRVNWGAKALDEFRIESERHTTGGVFEAVRAPNGKRAVIVICATRRQDIVRFEQMFSLIDPGDYDDWTKVTLLDLLMASKGDGPCWSCVRGKDGHRSALVFIAHDPRSIVMLERVFGLSP